MRYLRSLLHAAMSAWALAACGGGGGGGGTGPGQTGDITGTVRNASTDQTLEGATVSAGSIRATTDANGRFELPGVPVGPSVTIRSERTGFVASAEDITVQEGSNTHDIHMTRQSLYELPGVAVYVPPDVSTVRGVILGLGGDDTRGLATDVYNNPDPRMNESQRLTRQSFLTLAAKHGLAVMGSVAQPSEATVFAALDAVALASDRPEVAQAPILLRGISGGAPVSYAFTLNRPERVIGFMLIIAAGASPVRSAAAQHVPGYVVLAELDDVVDNQALTEFFVENRAEGALWSFAVEPGATHGPTSPALRTLLQNWMDMVLELRLPPPVTAGTPVALRSIDEASGWLGHRTTYAIASYTGYADNKLEASWFPSQGTAEAWQGFVMGR